MSAPRTWNVQGGFYMEPPALGLQISYDMRCRGFNNSDNIFTGDVRSLKLRNMFMPGIRGALNLQENYAVEVPELRIYVGMNT